MDINDILDQLGLDLSNPEVKRGALEAIEAILDSRVPPSSFGAGGGGGGSKPGEVEDVEIDPDLLQPSQKHQAQISDDDIEIEDEEDLLNKVKHNESDSDIEPDGNASGDDSSDTSSSENSSDADSADDADGDGNEGESSSGSGNSDNSEETSADKVEDENSSDEASDSDTSGNGGGNESGDESENESEGDGDGEGEPGEGEADEISDDSDFDYEEDDLLDDGLKNTYDDLGIKSKHEARKIKRERTLQAAKKALTDAQTKKVAPALIRELEKAITALEELTEAVKKSLKDISDDEFNLLINRVFDAIDAVGDKSLTFSSEEERALKAQEIKQDLASTNTKNELSAEDIAQIRAEHQAIKARDAEANKYKARSRSSFKGFQDFLNSLYRAIALQVHSEEIQDDTWSALNRRHSGSGVLQPGKRMQELPNKKIPVIDFYFDCSGSWGEDDIAVGKKAVSKLADMEADGQIKINIYYFSNDVFSDADSARKQGGTAGWNEIVKNVISTRATNVIIMTDADMEDWWNGPKALTYTVPGYVWYLWRDGENAPRLPRDLKGRGGTRQFSFSKGDV